MARECSVCRGALPAIRSIRLFVVLISVPFAMTIVGCARGVSPSSEDVPPSSGGSVEAGGSWFGRVGRSVATLWPFSSDSHFDFFGSSGTAGARPQLLGLAFREAVGRCHGRAVGASQVCSLDEPGLEDYARFERAQSRRDTVIEQAIPIAKKANATEPQTVAAAPGAAAPGAAAPDTASAPAAGAAPIPGPGVRQPESPLLEPLSVSVAQAFYEGDFLHVRVRVTAETPISTKDVALSVIGLYEGDEIEVHRRRLEKVLGDTTLAAGDAALVEFVLDQPNLTEYQVQCAWGADARKLIADDEQAKRRVTAAALAAESRVADMSSPEVATDAIRGAVTDSGAARGALSAVGEPAPQATELEQGVRSSPAPSLSGRLGLSQVEAHRENISCDGSSGCGFRYVLESELANETAEPRTGVKIAAGFLWTENDEQPAIPEDLSRLIDGEEIVDLGAARLEPGSRTKVKVALDQDVPDVPGGRFVPYLRLLSEGSAK